MNDEIIKEFFDLEVDKRGSVVKLVLYEQLKEDFDLVESQGNFDLLVNGRDFIDVKYDSIYFSSTQIRHVFSTYKKNNISNLYIILHGWPEEPLQLSTN